MTEITVNIEIYCGKCGTPMCNNANPRTSSSGRNQDPTFEIEPCEACLQASRDEGYDEGNEEGHQKGYEEGYSDGERGGNK